MIVVFLLLELCNVYKLVQLLQNFLQGVMKFRSDCQLFLYKEFHQYMLFNECVCRNCARSMV